MTRAGYVAIVGKPNAGKSTLLNRLVGEQLAITSPKPQSTRDRVVGIFTTGETQMVLLDTPGLLEPRYPLHHAMRAAARDALRDADVIVHLIDGSAWDNGASLWEQAGLERAPVAPVLVALNKVDLLPPTADQSGARALGTPGALQLSARDGTGVDALVARVGALLPESPFLFPEDDISTQPVRFFVAEMVREAALSTLSDEVPYALACEVDEYREERTPLYIRATLYVERDSQRGILIGAGGSRLRDVGRAARARVEAFVGRAVYLDLWVKVLRNWRRDPRALRRFGYHLPAPESP